MARPHELLDYFFSLSISSQESSLDFFIFFDDNLLHSQGFTEPFNFLVCLVCLAMAAIKSFLNFELFASIDFNLELATTTFSSVLR